MSKRRNPRQRRHLFLLIPIILNWWKFLMGIMMRSIVPFKTAIRQAVLHQKLALKLRTSSFSIRYELVPRPVLLRHCANFCKWNMTIRSHYQSVLQHGKFSTSILLLPLKRPFLNNPIILIVDYTFYSTLKASLLIVHQRSIFNRLQPLPIGVNPRPWAHRKEDKFLRLSISIWLSKRSNHLISIATRWSNSPCRTFPFFFFLCW